VRAILSLVRRDVMLALRQGGGIGAALGFMLAVIAMIPLSVGPDQALLQRLAPGLMWLTLLLAVLLTAERLFSVDLEDGSLDVMALADVPMELVVLAKLLAHWLTVSLPLALISPCLGFMFNLDASEFIYLLGGMVVGSLGLSSAAAIGGAVTAGLKRGGLMISLLVLPLYVPVLIFGIAAVESLGSPVSASMPLTMLVGITLLSLIAAPFAAAAALRIHLK
jgi:heme exporter protein B